MISLLERVSTIASDILEISRKRVTPSSSAYTIETWDSLHHLNLVLALEQEFGVQFIPEEIEKMNSIEEIVTLLETKTAG